MIPGAVDRVQGAFTLVAPLLGTLVGHSQPSTTGGRYQ